MKYVAQTTCARFEDPSAPFTLQEVALGSGVYSYAVRATDNLGAVATSAPATITVDFDPLHPPANTALRFDGIDDYVTMGATPELGLGGPPSNGMTIECWFRKEGAGLTGGSGSGGVTGVPLFGKGRGEGDGSTIDCDYFFGIDVSGHLVADFETYPATGLSSGQNYPVIATNAPIVNGTWYHAAATYDGPTAKWTLYLNGVQVGSANAAAGARPRFDSIQHFAIGTALDSSGVRDGAFAGRIDEVRVWNYVRSASEILAAKDSEIASAPGLVGRYGLNEASGTSAGNSVTVTGGPVGTLKSNPIWVEGAPFSSTNTPPVVTLDAPGAGDSTVYPAAFTLSASATDVGGTVVRVEFYVNGVKVGDDSTAPYSYSWAPSAVGSYAVLARSVDNLGATDTSAPVTLTVTPNPNQPPVVSAGGPADGATGIGSSTTLAVGIADPEGDGATVTFYGRKTVPETPGVDFTLIAIPDTQYYSENTPPGRFAQFLAQTNWIVSQKDTRNIAFVSHMGDIVDDGDSIPQQWVNANQAMSILEDHATVMRAYGLPFGAAPGNHDQSTNGDPNSVSSYYNQYFGTARYAGRPYWGGNYGVNNDNNYQLFSASGMDFIILHLEYRTAADPAVIAWADALLKAYPDRRAIVTSHWIIGQGNPASFGGQGQQIYDGLKNNPNLFLLLCGHIHAEGRRSDTFEGRTVYSVLQDYQGTSTGGSGFLRIFRFSPANNVITIESYSPTLGRAVNSSDGIPGYGGAFTLPYNMQSSVSAWVPLGTATVAPGGTTGSLDWTGLEKGSHYEWYAAVSDGINVTNGAPHRFSTAAVSAPVVALTAPASLDLDDPVKLTATASDADGTVTRVDFFQGNKKVGEDATAPYELTLPALPLGTYTFNATAIDDSKLATLSATSTVTVVQHLNDAPTVALTAPVSGSAFLAPSDISITAEATDSDGTIALVEFYNGNAKLGEVAAAPFALTLNAAPAGDYAFTAVATDNQGAQTTSSPVAITVKPALTTGVMAFDTMGTTITAPAGWQVFGNLGGSNTGWTNATGIPANAIGGGTANSMLIAATTFTASSNTQGYNFALPGSSTDRAIGTSPTSGNGVILQYTLTNTTGLAITAINVGYDIRRFTAPATVNSLPGYQLFYSLDGTTWTNVGELNPTVSGPGGIIVPNSVGVTTIPPTRITLAARWTAGSILRLRWVDDNAVESSPDQIIGLDNVTVTSAAAEPSIGMAPVVAFTSPVAGATYVTTDTIQLAANATDADGTVAKVEFYQGTTRLGEATAAPFSYEWTGAAVGSYALTAVATDNSNNVTASTPVTVTVTLAPGSSGTLLRGPYLNMANQDSIVIRWRSSQSTKGRVRYGLTPAALTSLTDETAAKTDHEVRLTGLTPYTRYYYSVGSAVDTLTPETVDTTSVRTAAYTIPTPAAADYTFRTSPLPGAATDTRIWIVGDCGRGSSSQAGGRDAYYNWMGNRVPDLNIQLGDNAYNSGTDAEYQTGYFLMYPTIFRKLPQWSALGNHDANNGVTNPATNFPYFDMFTFPTAGEAGGVASGTEHYYSFDYGNIHFICLDSQASVTTVDNPSTPLVNEDGPMATWLRQDLAATTSTWIVAFFHHPPYSKGSHDSDSEGQMVNMRTRFNPILEAGGVDLVLTGHSHNYERSVLLDGNYGITSTITPAMKINAGNGSTTGFTTGPNGVIRNAATGFTAIATVNGTVIPADGAYIKPLTGPRDHFGTVYNTAGMSGQADGGSLNHSAMYISYNSVGTVNLDISGNKLVATYVQAGGTAPDNYTIIKQGAADSDADGIPDDYEIANGLNRGSALDADLDLDGDRLSNRLEYGLNTAANSPNRTGLPILGSDAGKLTLTFNRARSELSYAVLATDDLKSWTEIAVNPGTAGTAVMVTDDNTVSPNRFLRLRISDGVSSVLTVPVGRTTYTLTKNQETAVSFSLHDVLGAVSGQPAGFITAVGANTLDNANAGWTPGQLSQPSAPYLVHITSGAASGMVFPVATNVGDENTATRLIVATGGVNLTTLGIVAGTDTYELIPADTLGTLFPAGALLSGGATTADTLRLWTGSDWVTYFHDGAHWQQVGGVVADTTLVRPDQGWMLLRRGQTANFVILGEVSSTDAKAAVQRGGSSYVSLLSVPQTFAEFSLQTLLPSWSSNPSNPTGGDYVRLWNGSLWLNYYYNGTKWMRQGAGDAGTTQLIKAGRPFFIVRPAGSGSDVLTQIKPY